MRFLSLFSAGIVALVSFQSSLSRAAEPVDPKLQRLVKVIDSVETNLIMLNRGKPGEEGEKLGVGVRSKTFQEDLSDKYIQTNPTAAVLESPLAIMNRIFQNPNVSEPSNNCVEESGPGSYLGSAVRNSPGTFSVYCKNLIASHLKVYLSRTREWLAFGGLDKTQMQHAVNPCFGHAGKIMSSVKDLWLDEKSERLVLLTRFNGTFHHMRYDRTGYKTINAFLDSKGVCKDRKDVDTNLKRKTE